jgi:hypothetical protein
MRNTRELGGWRRRVYQSRLGRRSHVRMKVASREVLIRNAVAGPWSYAWLGPSCEDGVKRGKERERKEKEGHFIVVIRVGEGQAW